MSNSIANTLIDSLFDTINLAAKLIFNKSKSKDLDYFFQSVSLKNKLNECPLIINSSENSYVIKVPVGLNISDFIKIQDSLETYLNYNVNLKLDNEYLKISKAEKQELPNFINYKLPTQEDKQKLRISIGESFSEKILYWEPLKIPHVLCSGATGSGKSVCTKSIISSVLNTFNESQAELVLIDFKIIELNTFRNCKQVIKYTYEVDEALEIISDLLCECRNRYKLFQELEVTSLKDYNLKSKNKLKYQFIFIEEFIVLSQHKRGIKMLQELISLSRASAQFIYISCQRPDHTVISPIIKANVGNKICFHTEDTKNSIIILDKEGGESLSGNGHGLLKQGSQITEFQGYYISDNEVKEIIKTFMKPKEVKEFKTELNQNININDKLVTKHIETATNPNDKVTDITEKNKIIDLSFIDNL